MVFSPKPAYKLGPYIGWRWIFLGYTIDLTHLGNGDGRRDLNLSLYSNQIGVDLFYRKSGNGYRINSVTLAPNKRLDKMEDVPLTDSGRVSGASTSIISSTIANSHIPRLTAKARCNGGRQAARLSA